MKERGRNREVGGRRGRGGGLIRSENSLPPPGIMGRGGSSETQGKIVPGDLEKGKQQRVKGNRRKKGRRGGGRKGGRRRRKGDTWEGVVTDREVDL